ncbi:MAG: hypothetical protein JWO86_2131 [Myxococcaceae bacterium]|nr:hypothetical protein [Myxococcaceae bacterium]
MTTGDDSGPREVREVREMPRMNRVLLLYGVLPLIAATSVWLWIHHQRAIVRDRGVSSCIASRQDAAWCEEAAAKNHDGCMDLTFRPGTRTSSESFDDRGYVECLGMGADAYWKLSSERAALKRPGPRLP